MGHPFCRAHLLPQPVLRHEHGTHWAPNDHAGPVGVPLLDRPVRCHPQPKSHRLKGARRPTAQERPQRREAGLPLQTHEKGPIRKQL